MNIAECYASLARMLDYPDRKNALLQDHDIVGRQLAQCSLESPLTPFAEFVKNSTEAELQEEYVATFDFNPSVAPYLGHHLYGDNQKKGAYLIGIKQEFARFGFAPDSCELPDHLPLILEFLAHLSREGKDDERRAFISEWVLPGVEKLSAGFDSKKDSPWKPLVDTVSLLCAADGAVCEEVIHA